MTTLTGAKLIEVEDFAAPELRPHLKRIAHDDALRLGLPEAVVAPDAQHWVGAMALKALVEAGATGPGKFVAGVGAGVDPLAFTAASDGAVVFACDTYLELTPRTDVAPAAMMVRPRQFSMLDYPCGHVVPVHGDPRRLELPTGFFDGVYCADPFSALDSFEAVEAVAMEAARILKPGGVASVTGLFRLEGPNDRAWVKETGLLFTADAIERHIVRASGLVPVSAFSDRISPRTYEGQSVLQDFMRRAVKVETLQDKRNASPNLVLFHEGFAFCAFHLTLRKPADAAAPARPRSLPRKIAASVEARSIGVSGALAQQMSDWRDAFAQDDDPQRRRAQEITRLTAELAEAHACLAAVSAENHRTESALLALQPGSALPQWVWREVCKVPLSKLHTFVGTRDAQGLRSDGTPGVLAYGPYMGLEIGHYAAEFSLRSLGGGGEVICAVTGGGPPSQVGTDLGALQAPVLVPFTLDQPVASSLEFPVTVTAGTNVELRAVRLLRRRPQPS